MSRPVARRAAPTGQGAAAAGLRRSRQRVVQGGPPASLARFPIFTHPRLEPMYRFARLDPWWFCQCGGCRFDLPAGAPHGTMYAGLDPVTGVLETLGPEMDGRPIGRAFLAQRTVWALAYDQPQVFADLTGPRAVSFGVTNELSSMTPYDVPQQWAAAFDAAGLDGIRYRARFKVDGDATALAVFDAAGGHPTAHKTRVGAGDDPSLVTELGRYVDVEDGGAAPLSAFDVVA